MRVYEPSKFDGVIKSIKSVDDRRSLLNKRIGFDIKSSSLSQIGKITNPGNRVEVEINHVWYKISEITQVVLLNDQNEGGKWKA